MRNKKSSGFTLAEMLAAVAILVILFGLIAVAVAAYQRSQTRLEFDSIAKEIFIAAQNHLSAAEGQGYLGLEETEDGAPVSADKLTERFGTIEENSADTDGEGSTTGTKAVVRYMDNGQDCAVLELMLPAYALDATVLNGGSYIIRYQPHPARVLDVFYSKEGKSGLLGASGTTLTVADYNALMVDPNYTEGKEKQRERYQQNGTDYVIGWYGGDKEIEQGDHLGVPTIEIINEEQLYVKVTDPNKNAKTQSGNELEYTLVLVVKGKTSGAQKHFELNGLGDDRIDSDTETSESQNFYSVLLDDVTMNGGHFAELKPEVGGAFSPGEDLEIYAVAFSKEALANVAKSPAQTTNSLFADPLTYTEGEEVRGTDVAAGVAGIAYFRHLENLEESVSGRLNTLPETDGDEMAPLTKAGQMSDLDWDTPWKDWKGEERSWAGNSGEQIASSDGKTALTDPGCFYPVSPDAALTYLGNPPETPTGEEPILGHIVKGVKIDHEGPAGMFGTLPADSEVQDLKLIDFNVKGTNAGALIGESGTITVENVVAHNSVNSETHIENHPDYEINGTGNAGGLIGKMVGGEVTECAAALYVSGTGNAGGLIGSASGVTLSDSYSGGHTYSDEDSKIYAKYMDVGTVRGAGNVSGATTGGLIGSMNGGSVENCYSTCSARGTDAAGGLIGSASGTVTNCYATGRVECMDDNDENVGKTLFGGEGNFEGGSGNWYFGSANPNLESGDESARSISGSLTDYAEYCEAFRIDPADTGSFIDAKPYDPLLSKIKYPVDGKMVNKYPFGKLFSTLPDSYVKDHYGDWPEELVVNES